MERTKNVEDTVLRHRNWLRMSTPVALVLGILIGVLGSHSVFLPRPSSGTRSELRKLAMVDNDRTLQSEGEADASATSDAATQTNSLPTYCPISATNATDSANSTEPNLFEGLGEEEYAAVEAYMTSESVAELLKLASLIRVELLAPNKAEVLAYWAGNGSRPVRTARVEYTFERGGEYYRAALKVWPASSPEDHARIPLVGKVLEVPYIYPWSAHKVAEEILPGRMFRDARPLLPLIRRLYPNATVVNPNRASNCTSRCLVATYYDPITLSDARGGVRLIMAMVFQNEIGSDEPLEGEYLHYLNALEFVYDVSHAENVTLLGFSFLGSIYKTAAELMDAWQRPSNKALRAVSFNLPGSNQEALFSNFRRRPGPVRNPEQPVGPLAYDVFGHRFSVSRNRITWMGWSVEVSLAFRGVRFFDLRFKEELLAYEISMQEAVAAYGAPDMALNHVNFMDAALYGIGYLAQQQLYGVDCPSNGVLHDIPSFKGRTCLRCLCVFEHDTSVPLLSHQYGSDTGAGAVRDTVLVVRTKHTVDNYDYFHDLKLHLDGVVHVSVMLTGFMSGSAYLGVLSDNFTAGPLSSVTTGSLHDHTVNWKVDLDVGRSLGANNSVQTIGVQPRTITDAITQTPWYSKMLQRTYPQTEKDSTFVHDPLHPKQVLFVDGGDLNAHGRPRGYSIDATLHHNPTAINPDDPLIKVKAWSKYNIAVTVRDENEWTSTWDDDWFKWWDPVLDFDSYLSDNQPVVGQDLVAWVTSGLFHFTRAEDAPVTPGTHAGVHPGFTLHPFNYFNENAAMDLPDLFTITADMPYNERVPLIQRVMANPNLCQPQYADLPFVNETLITLDDMIPAPPGLES